MRLSWTHYSITLQVEAESNQVGNEVHGESNQVENLDTLTPT